MKRLIWLILLAVLVGYAIVKRHDLLSMFPPLRNVVSMAGSLAVTAPAGQARAKAAAQRVKPILEPDLAAKGLHWGDPVFLRAFKEEAELELYVLHRESKRFVLFRTYTVAAQSGTLGPKLREGDGQVPEGFYAVGKNAMKPDSRYHLAFNIGYPNAYDLAHQRTGSFIMVHGNQVSIGCLAMTDEKIEEIYSLCDAALQGEQPYFRVHIFPFRMTEERMEKARDSEHHEFWQNLREGYQRFETNGLPAETTVRDKRYHFAP